MRAIVEGDGVLFVTESFSEFIAQPVARGETPLWAARGSLFDLLVDLGIRSAPVRSRQRGATRRDGSSG